MAGSGKQARLYPDPAVGSAAAPIAAMGMGMDLLVRTSGVARESIYRCFATKDDVAAAAVSERDVRLPR